MFSFPRIRIQMALCFRPMTVLSFVAVTACPVLSCPNELAELKRSFSAQRAELTSAYQVELNTLRRAHRAIEEELRCARRETQRLCGAQKSATKKAINHAQKDAAKSYQCAVGKLKTRHRTVIRDLDAQYTLARRSLKCVCNSPPHAVGPIATPFFGPSASSGPPHCAVGVSSVGHGDILDSLLRLLATTRFARAIQ